MKIMIEKSSSDLRCIYGEYYASCPLRSDVEIVSVRDEVNLSGYFYCATSGELVFDPKSVPCVFESLEALAALDVQSLRPLRAVMAAMIEGRAPDAEDEKRLVEIEKQAVAERAKVKKGE